MLSKKKPSSPLVTPATRSARPIVQTPMTAKPIAQPKPTNTVFSINTAQVIKEVIIPDTIKDIFTNDVQVPEGNDIATIDNVTHVAMLLFANYIDAATAMSDSCGGGGGLLLNLVGARRTMKMTGSLPTVAHRWLMPCASLNHAAEVSTDKSMII